MGEASNPGPATPSTLPAASQEVLARDRGFPSSVRSTTDDISGSVDDVLTGNRFAALSQNPPVPRRLVLVGAESRGRRVVLVPQSTGTPRSIQDVADSEAEPEGPYNNFVVAMDADDEERHSVSPSLLDDLERELDPTVLDGGSPTLSTSPDDSERDDVESELRSRSPRRVGPRFASPGASSISCCDAGRSPIPR